MLSKFVSSEIGFFKILFALHSQTILLINCITVLKNVCQVWRGNKTNWCSTTSKAVFWHCWDEVEISTELVPSLEPDVSSYFNVNGLAKLREPRNQKLQIPLAIPKEFQCFILQWWCFPESVNYGSSESLNCLNHYWLWSLTSLYHDWLFSHEFRDAIRLRAVLCCSSWRWREIIMMYLSLIWQENCYYKRVKSQQSSNIITSFLSSEEMFYKEDHICMGWLHEVCVSCSTWFLRLFC